MYLNSHIRLFLNNETEMNRKIEEIFTVAEFHVFLLLRTRNIIIACNR